MKVKIKKHSENAVIPSYAKPGDAGLDLVAVEKNFIGKKGYLEYDTKISVEIPDGYVGLIFPRSSISNYHLILTNSVGVIDSKFRGTIKFRFKKSTIGAGMYEVGDKIGQLIIMPYPQIEFEEVEELDETERGENGWGSTGE